MVAHSSFGVVSVLLCSTFWVNLDYWTFVDRVDRFVGVFLVSGGDPVTTERRRTWPPALALVLVFWWGPQMVARPCSCSSFRWGSSDDRKSAHMAARTRSRFVFRWGPQMVARPCSCSSFRWGPQMVTRSSACILDFNGDCKWSLTLVRVPVVGLGRRPKREDNVTIETRTCDLGHT